MLFTQGQFPSVTGTMPFSHMYNAFQSQVHAHKAMPFSHSTCTQGNAFQLQYMYTMQCPSVTVHAHWAMSFSCKHIHTMGNALQSQVMHTRAMPLSPSHVHIQWEYPLVSSTYIQGQFPSVTVTMPFSHWYMHKGAMPFSRRHIHSKGNALQSQGHTHNAVPFSDK